MAEADWELSKENVQPLKQGRDVNTLKDVLAQHEALSHISIQEQKQAFETEIRFYSGNDPLDVWDRYVKWTEQTFPHGGTDSNHLALLERALKLFLKDDRYYSDLRYLGHWLKFVDYCTDPLEMFDFLNSKGIGVSHAALYVAWAERFELLGNNKKAEAILQEGIRLNAEPVEKLQHNLRHFQSRVFKQVVASIAEGTNENSTLEPTQQRTSLGDLKRRGQKRAMAPVKRVGIGVQSLNQGLGHYVAPAQEQCGTFEVFNENRLGTQPVEDQRSTVKQWSTLPSTSAKENEIVPGPWNTSGMRVPRHSSVHAVPFSTALSAKKPDFKLYEEESSHEETMTPRKIEPLFTPVLSARKPSKELNPLTRVQVQNCNENTEVSMYSKDQIYAGLREFSFEELRAEEFKKKYKAHMKEQEEKLLKLKQEKEEVEQLIHMAELRMKEQREHSQPETQQNEAIHDPLPCSAITTREFGTDINLSERNGEDSDRNGLNEIASRLKNANLSDCTDTINHMSSDLVTCSQMSDKNPFDNLDSGSRDCNKEDLEYEAQFMKCADNSHLSSVSALMPPFLGLPPASAAFSIFDETAEAEIQNKPPASYLKLNTQWRRSGILVPSQHLVEEICSAACDDLDGIEPLNEDHFVSSDYPNKTLGPYPENTCDFSRGAHLVSTPFHRNTLTDDQENSIKQNCIDGSKNALSSLSPIKESLFDQPLHMKKLSPIQEASEDGLSSAATTSSSAVSSSSVGGLGTMSDLNVLEKLELGHLNPCETNSMNSTSDNPWDLEIKKQLLSSLLVPLSSFPEFHVQNSPVPTFEDGLELTLGSQTFNIKLAAVHEQYRVFYGTNPRLSLSRAIIKVHSHTVPWDFYINQQLKMRLGSKFNNYFSQNHSCYLFENGCVTVDRGKNCETLQGLSQMWETVPEALVVFLTLDLLALVELMHTAEIVHGGIAPETLFMDDRFYEGSACPSGDGLVKLMDFAHSLDLKLQSGVITFMKFPTMQSLSNKELVFGCTNAYQVDLLGIANTVHFLLFGGEIDVSKQGSLWTLGPTSSRMELLYLELWNNFFEKILNTGGASSVSTLSDLRQTVTEVIEPDYEILYNDAFTLMPHD